MVASPVMVLRAVVMGIGMVWMVGLSYGRHIPDFAKGTSGVVFMLVW